MANSLLQPNKIAKRAKPKIGFAQSQKMAKAVGPKAKGGGIYAKLNKVKKL